MPFEIEPTSKTPEQARIEADIINIQLNLALSSQQFANEYDEFGPDFTDGSRVSDIQADVYTAIALNEDDD